MTANSISVKNSKIEGPSEIYYDDTVSLTITLTDAYGNTVGNPAMLYGYIEMSLHTNFRRNYLTFTLSQPGIYTTEFEYTVANLDLNGVCPGEPPDCDF